MQDSGMSFTASLIILATDIGGPSTDSERDYRITRLLNMNDVMWKELGVWIDKLSDSPRDRDVRAKFLDICVLRDLKPDI